MPYPRLLLPLLFPALVTACANGAGNGDFITYTDAQGNLITVPAGEEQEEQEGQDTTSEKDSKAQEPEEPRDRVAAGDEPGEKETVPAEPPQEAPEPPEDHEPADVYQEVGPFGVGAPEYTIPVEREAEDLEEAILKEYRGGDETYEEMRREQEEQERDRFVTWTLPDGTPVTQPFDAIESREQRQRERQAAIRPLGTDEEEGRPWLETAMPVRTDCCVDVVDSLPELAPGRERVFSFQDRKAIVEVDGREFRVVGVRLAPEVSEIRIRSYVKGGGYLHPHLLLLDEDAEPQLAVNNLFTERHSSTWYRHGYLAGSLEREPEHRYLVLYLPYEEGLDTGFVQESDLSLETSGEVVILGRE